MYVPLLVAALGACVVACSEPAIAAGRTSASKIATSHASPPVSAVDTSPTPQAEPYEFRGARLGMEYEAFKALPYPDKDDPSHVSVDVELHCSDRDYGDYSANAYAPKAMKD